MVISSPLVFQSIQAAWSHLWGYLDYLAPLTTVLFARLNSVPRIVKIAAGLTLVYSSNKALNRRALNNGTLNHPWDWSKEIILVTGGSSGIGERIVRGFAERGIKVVVLDLHPPNTPFPENVVYYSADVNVDEAVSSAAEKIRSHIGDPTVLINNAGVATAQTILEGTDEGSRRTVNVNLLAQFVTLREFLPSMIKHNHGHVVSIASLASFITIVGNVDYSCSKAALLALHEGLTQELRHLYGASSVRTSIIHPMFTRTLLIKPFLGRKLEASLLDADDVANSVITHVLKGESGQIVLPSRVGFVAHGIRSWPSWLQEYVRDRASGTMKGWPKA